MDCKNLKIRCKNYKKYIYCISFKKEITYENCKNCAKKEYKSQKNIQKCTKNYKNNKKSAKIVKLERNRFSLITDDLNRCIECGSKFDIELHEVFFGKNRQNSMIHGCVIPLCRDCHKGSDGIHFNKHLDLKWKSILQASFETIYSHDEFMDIFKKNYL